MSWNSIKPAHGALAAFHNNNTQYCLYELHPATQRQVGVVRRELGAGVHSTVLSLLNGGES